MRILGFTDVHGKVSSLEKVKAKSADADIIVCCGDISIFEERLDHLLTRLNSMEKLTFIIPGNHESEKRLKNYCMKFKNLFFLHEEIAVHDGITFVGYGGGGFSTTDAEFEEFIRKNEAKLVGKIVLVTHGPPYGTRTDDLGTEHVGNKSYRDFIKKYKPVANICGHIHENAGEVDKIGDTLIINPGPEGRIIEV